MRSFTWRGGLIPCQAPTGPFEAVDSWRHSCGRAHGLGLHLERFCRTAGPLPARFVDQMLALLEEGELFPRLSQASGELFLDVRPAPPARPATRLTYAAAPDPRTRPRVKGPDFPAFQAYRETYQAPGTDDTVIAGPDGAMAETTTGALALWDGDTLCLPAGAQLPSVTAHQVAAQARSLGYRVTRRPLYPQLAADRPLWFLNSLHGISPVTEIHTLPGIIASPPHPDLAAWQQWWRDGFTQT